MHATSYVAPSAVLAGDVLLDAEVSVWYGAVIRADLAPIRIRAASNIQDGAVLHADPGLALEIGARVTVGHRAVLHGCSVADGALIGIGAVVLNGAAVGRGSLIAAGTVVPEGMEIPPGVLVTGVPARIKRLLSDAEISAIGNNADVYVRLAETHRRGQVQAAD